MITNIVLVSGIGQCDSVYKQTFSIHTFIICMHMHICIHTYENTYMYVLFQILFHDRMLKDTEYLLYSKSLFLIFKKLLMKENFLNLIDDQVRNYPQLFMT